MKLILSIFISMLIVGCSIKQDIIVENNSLGEVVFSFDEKAAFQIYRVDVSKFNPDPTDYNIDGTLKSVWLSEGKAIKNNEIIYGKTPEGFKNIVEPKELMEGIIYVVSIDGSSKNASLIATTCFQIKNRNVYEVYC